MSAYRSRGLRRIPVRADVVLSLLTQGSAGFTPSDEMPEDLQIEHVASGRSPTGPMLFLFVSSEAFTHDADRRAMEGRESVPEWIITYLRHSERPV